MYLPLRKSYEVVGAFGDGAYLCRSCAGPELLDQDPVLLDEVTDEDICDVCASGLT